MNSAHVKLYSAEVTNNTNINNNKQNSIYVTKIKLTIRARQFHV